MSRPSDAHLDHLDDAAYSRARDAITALEGGGVSYTLGGGWAVYAHVPRLPSVDVDVFVPGDATQVARELLEAEGLNVARGGEVETLSLDGEIELWGVGDPDLGIPSPGYVPAIVLEGRKETRPIPFDSGDLQANVPSPAPLLVTKIVALANRDLAYRATFEGEAGMRLGPTLGNRVRARSGSYWRRKAGKDLFDVRLLLSEMGQGDTARTILDEQGLLEDVRTRTMNLHEDTVELADDLQNRLDMEEPSVVLEDWLG